jgi:hypothetical protein
MDFTFLDSACIKHVKSHHISSYVIHSYVKRYAEI